MEKLKIEYLPISVLTPYEKNTRKHKDYDVGKIAQSIETYGFDDPIGIWGERNVIVEGHGRLLAAKKLKLKEVPCIRLDHLTDEQRREYAILHNKTAELSEWDFDNLADELADLDLGDFDIDFGIDEEEEEPELVEDEPPAVDADAAPKAKPGDIYQLGEHRLMCGDSTSISDLQQLLNGSLADCVITDPPYNMGYEGAGNTEQSERKSKRILNDNLKDDEFRKFLQGMYKTMREGMKDGASFYVFYKELGAGVFITTMKEADLNFKQELIWVKNQIVLGGSKYQSMYEPCLFGCKGKRVANWNAGRKERSVIESVDLMNEEELRQAIRELTESEETDIIRENKQLKNDLHPTMKPIKLLARFVKNSSKPGESILDLFGGSGSTLMTCEQMGRKCCMMELDPKYVDVIIKRWENFTGEKAVQIAGDENLIYELMLYLFYNGGMELTDANK